MKPKPLDLGDRLRLVRAKQTITELGDPCLDCACCTKWAAALELAEASARVHLAGEVRLQPCHDDCVVCALGR